MACVSFIIQHTSRFVFLANKMKHFSDRIQNALVHGSMSQFLVSSHLTFLDFFVDLVSLYRALFVLWPSLTAVIGLSKIMSRCLNLVSGIVENSGHREDAQFLDGSDLECDEMSLGQPHGMMFHRFISHASWL